MTKSMIDRNKRLKIKVPYNNNPDHKYDYDNDYDFDYENALGAYYRRRGRLESAIKWCITDFGWARERCGSDGFLRKVGKEYRTDRDTKYFGTF